MNEEKRHRINIVSSFTAVFVAFSLAMLKFAVAAFTGSIAVFASAVDNWLDFMISSINLYTLHAAHKPPDAEHGFGHGKFEAIAELLQGIFIAFSGIYLIYKSVERLFQGVPIASEGVGVAVMVVSMVVSFMLLRFLQNRAKLTGSLILKTETAHYKSDILANIGVIASLIAAKYTGFSFFDPLISLFIAVLILHSSWQLLTESHEILTDREMPDAFRHEIIRVIETGDKRIAGWHKLRTRHSGVEKYIDFHLSFVNGISLQDAHDITDSLERKIQKKFKDASVLIHMEPDEETKDAAMTHTGSHEKS